MSGIVFETFDGDLRGTILCAPAKDWVVTLDAAGNRVFAVEAPAHVASESHARCSVLCAPAKDWSVSRDVAVNGVFAVAAEAIVYSTSIPVEPTVNLGFCGEVLPGVAASGHLTFHGSVVCAPANDWVVAREVAGNTVAAFTSLDQAHAIQYPEFVGFLYCAQTSGYAYLLAPDDGVTRIRIETRLALDAAALSDLINGLVERIRISTAPKTMLQAVNLLRDTTDFTDAIAVVWKMLLAESMKAGDNAAPSVVAIETVLDGLRLLAGPNTTLACRNLVAQTLALNDAIAVLAKEQLSDAAALSAALATALTARSALVDGLLAGDIASGSAIAHAVLDESMAMGDTPATVLEALNTVREHIGFSITLRIGDDVYVAWVCNTETRAQWQYTHWPFNSMCEFEGRYYGAQDDGIYDLTGDTDAGEDIKARIRLGLSDMGIRREKRMPSLYLSYTATDCLVLKAIVAEIDGTRSEYWYRLVPRGGGELREGRIKLGRGLKAVLYDFIIENVNGGDFALDALEFFPLVLDRRVKGRDE